MRGIGHHKRYKFKSVAFGEYLMDQYFFKVFTKERKTVKLEQLDLPKLQSEHIVSIVHEYTHYLHEVSTHIGTICLNYAVAFRAILSKYVDPDLSTSAFLLDISQEDADYIAAIEETMEYILGDMALAFPVTKITGYQLTQFTVKVPEDMHLVERQFEIPEIEVQNGEESIYLLFGKFYLYEGIAYELEREYARSIRRAHDDEEDGTEYTILRYFSTHIVPTISIRTMLTLASLSLAYMNCGAMYVSMLQRLAIELEKGLPEAFVVEMVRSNVQQEYLDREGLLEEVLEEIEKTYALRSSLNIAFADLKLQYIRAAQERIQNPAFEVDMIFEHQLEDLLERIPPCDYMFVFNNKNTFLRDFYGTSKFKSSKGKELAIHHNIFIAHIHYASVLFYTLIGDIDAFKAHADECCCPFFTSCDLIFRKQAADVCQSTPWKTYDIAYKTDKLFCWYGSGVGFLKGIDIPPPQEVSDTF